MGLWDHFLFHLPLPVTVFGVEGYRVLTMLAPSVYVKISFSLAPHCATKPNTKLLDTVGSISYYIYVYIYMVFHCHNSLVCFFGIPTALLVKWHLVQILGIYTLIPRYCFMVGY